MRLKTNVYRTELTSQTERLTKRGAERGGTAMEPAKKTSGKGRAQRETDPGRGRCTTITEIVPNRGGGETKEKRAKEKGKRNGNAELRSAAESQVQRICVAVG